jgi:hypothetical protein
MKHYGSVTLALTVLAFGAFVADSVIAQTKMDCGRLYKDFWQKLDREKFAKLSGDQLAAVSRWGLRAYDNCQAGDEAEAQEMFDRLHMTLF